MITSFLVLLLEKTRLPDLYAWILAPGLRKSRLKATPRPKEIAGKTEDIIPNGDRLFGGTTDTKKRSPKEDEDS